MPVRPGSEGLKPASSARYLLCSDLDRTLIPNGMQEESPAARATLRALVMRAAFSVVYVTGRNRALVEAAIREHDLPWPDAVIGDVGSCIWSTFDASWSKWPQWEDRLRQDWDESRRAAIFELLHKEPGLEAQSDDRQSALKLSFLAEVGDLPARCRRLRLLLRSKDLHANIIGSIDEVEEVGLIDVLPPLASKHSAIEMLMSSWGFQHWNTVCAGDSGNDLPFLTSALQSVLVANAEDSVRQRAVRLAARRGQQANLYLARGGFLGMNGYYSAGVLEGLAHYLPDIHAWIEAAAPG